MSGPTHLDSKTHFIGDPVVRRSEVTAERVTATARFVGSGDRPYEPRRSSPLCGRGQLMDWMVGAYDIRSDADAGKYLRRRDGKVDIGCYQCWLDPEAGMMLFLR